MRRIFEAGYKVGSVLLFLTSLCPCSRGQQLTAKDFAVLLTATTALDPPEIQLHWAGDPNARTYRISRKLLNESTWNPLAVVGGGDTVWSDRNVQPGIGYEYQVIKTTTFDYTGYGYIYAGIRLPLSEQRGKILLVIEQSLLLPLHAELDRFEYDLVGDCWTVARLIVSARDTVVNVKKAIVALYDNDPVNTKAAVLLGNIPVPYSGDITPDEHANHQGAWPADVYYGDIDGAWTDTTTISTNAERFTNWNLPGDGKFDQSLLPSKVELQIGRVDLSRMTCYANKNPPQTEIDLMRRYLSKNHQFRHAEFLMPEQSVIMDLIGMRSPEPMSAMSWRNSAPLVGENVITENTLLFPLATTNNFLFGFLCGGGSWTYSTTTGTSDVFAENNLNIVFMACVGSYFGDWDNESNFLRAALGAKGKSLTSCYAGKPQWLFHPLALGETIGCSLKITQENGPEGLYPPYNPGTGMVHISLLGDPTLRAHPVPPVSNIQSITQAQFLTLTWRASPAQNLEGYLIFKSSRASGPYQKLTPSPILANTFLDLNHVAGQFYMVRAVALKETPSGSYYNASEGTIFPDPIQLAQNARPPTPSDFSFEKVTATSITIKWLPAPGSYLGFGIERKAPGEQTFSQIAAVPINITSFQDTQLPTVGLYRYCVRAWGIAGLSDYTPEITTTTASGSAEFLSYDFTSSGNWESSYGNEGYAFPGQINLPQVIFSLHNITEYFGGISDDPRIPVLPNLAYRVDRIWAAYVIGDIDILFTDSKPHQVSLYSYDTDPEGRLFDLKVIDAVSGNILDNRTIESYANGVYLSYMAKEHVLFRLTPHDAMPSTVSGRPLTVAGLYIDPVKVRPLTITPTSGSFIGKTEISIVSSTPNAEIRYTLDGTVPTRQSALYSAPLAIHSTADLKARAFRDGFEDSPVAEGCFTNLVSNQMAFLKWDDFSSGSWLGKFGQEGYLLPFGARAPANYAEVEFQGAENWLWSESTDSSSALQKGSSFSDRIASCWFAQDSFTLDLSVLDSQSHSVAFYFLDWDQKGRAERIDFFNADGDLLQTFEISNFTNGRYLVMNIQGYTRVKISRLQGNNAVLNGIFFDPSPAPLGPPQPTPLKLIQITNNSLTFNLTGNLGQKISLDRSVDLKNWTPIQTNTFLNTSIFMTVPQNSAKEFFRVHFLQ